MERKEFAPQLLRFMKRYDRFVISGHVRPDGDSVGACTAMALALKNMGKEAFICYDGNPHRYTSVLAPTEALPDNVSMRDAGSVFRTGRSFAFIMVDCSEPDRTGRASEGILYATASLSVDHHVTSVEATDFSYCEPETSSASQILYKLFQLMEVEITGDMAKALFMGVAYDTGGFRHSNTSVETFAMAADLRDKGVDSSFMMNYLFHTVPMRGAKAYSAALSKAKIYAGGILISCMGLSDFVKAGISPQAADGVVGNLTEIEEASVVCYLRELEDGTIRVNMRSKCDVNVAKVASIYGGGGHVLAAGCTAREPMLLVKQTLLEAIRRQMPGVEPDSAAEQAEKEEFE